MFPSEIAEYITMKYKDKGMTQQQFCEEVGISRQALFGWAKGKPPSMDVLRKVNAVLGTSFGITLLDEKKPVPTDGNGLNDREKLVLSLFNRLPAANQEGVIAQLQGLVQFQAAQDARSKSE